MIKNHLTRLFSKKDIPRITYDAMDEVEDFTPLVLDSDSKGRILGEKIPVIAAGIILFRNTGEAGSKYIMHDHDCREVCTVQKGAVRFGNKILRAGDSISYPPYVIHDAVWVESGVMYVQFNKVY